MGKLIRKATGLTVGMATLLAGLLLPMTASAESASPIDASPIIHYSFDNALTSKTIANEGAARPTAMPPYPATPRWPMARST